MKKKCLVKRRSAVVEIINNKYIYIYKIEHIYILIVLFFHLPKGIV